MKLGKIATAFFLSTAMSFPVFSASELPEKNSLMAKILAATDARDHENVVFDEAIKAGRFEALAYLGQIGGDACQKLVPYLRGENTEAQKWAANGAMLCHDQKLSTILMEQFSPSENKAAFAKALGFSGAEEARAAIAGVLKDRTAGAETDEILFGLLQAVAYGRVNAADIDGLNILQLLDFARDDDSYAAAYLLARLQGLPDVLPYNQFEPAFLQLVPKSKELSGTRLEIARVMARLAREYGDGASTILMLAVETAEPTVRHEAIRSLGRMNDAQSKALLMKLADEGADVATRHLAVDALGQRSANDPALLDVLMLYVSDDVPWVATTATRWLGQRDPDAANEIAAGWLGGDDYYLAFQALIALSGSDEGKAILKAYADKHPDTIRGYEAAVALDPSIEAATASRKSPDYNTVTAYQGRSLVLETTRGNICIAMTGDAPYAATNFLQLADFGKMDGMLWHRVIPNFVSQAGQIEDKEIGKWGSIREEWGGEHRIGTVGVATAGRDTGTVQFFINTGYNMHLDNRYTVFGAVYDGLERVYELQEGDVIKKAYTAKGQSAACE